MKTYCLNCGHKYSGDTCPKCGVTLNKSKTKMSSHTDSSGVREQKKKAAVSKDQPQSKPRRNTPPLTFTENTPPVWQHRSFLKFLPEGCTYAEYTSLPVHTC